jgi:hypothetical protein
LTAIDERRRSLDHLIRPQEQAPWTTQLPRRRTGRELLGQLLRRAATCAEELVEVAIRAFQQQYPTWAIHFRLSCQALPDVAQRIGLSF